MNGTVSITRKAIVTGRSRRYCSSAVLVAVLSVVAGCAPGPSSDGQESQERRLEDAESARVVGDYGGVYGNPKLSGWVGGLGQALVAHSGHPDLRCTFTVLDSGQVNAFSTPGGHVYITRGLLTVAANEAEVAAALGHEIGHVLQGDHRREGRPKPAPGGGGTLLALLSGVSRLLPSAGTAGSDPGDAFPLDDEFGADQLGIAIIAQAGYDPAAAASLLTALESHTGSAAMAPDVMPTGGGSQDYARTHPVTADRVAAAIRLAAAQPGGARRLALDSYLRAVDGMRYGGGPGEGYERNGVFVLPAAGVRLILPAGFIPRGSASAMIAIGADQATLVLTGARPGSVATPLDYLQGRWARGVAFDSAEPILVGSLPAAMGAARIVSDRGPVNVRMIVIGWSPALIYRMILLCPAASRADPDLIARELTAGFGALTGADAQKLPPYHLRIVAARRGDTIARIVRRMPPLSEGRESIFRALNRLAAGMEVRPGQSLKIIE